jgi:hypothetical protein
MAKPLSCWVGRHDWTTRVDQGEKYKVCSKCGGAPRRGMKNPDTHGSHQSSQHYSAGGGGKDAGLP